MMPVVPINRDRVTCDIIPACQINWDPSEIVNQPQTKDCHNNHNQLRVMPEVVNLGAQHVARAAGEQPDESLELEFVQFRLPKNDIVRFVEYQDQL